LQIYLLGQLDQPAASAQMQQLMSAAATRIAAQSHIK
jgi:hypothetical protein